MYHLRGEDDFEEEIRQGLEKKLDAMRTDSSTHNTRPLLPKNSGSRRGRSILTGVECRRATDGLPSLGTVTGACHAPVAGGQVKSLADTAPRIPVPIEKPADFEMDGGENFQNSLCLWAAALKQI